MSIASASIPSVNVTQLLRRSIVEHSIGGGGSATVHKCRVVEPTKRLPLPGTLVAVKEYKPSILEVPGQLDRIRQEADLGLKLQHPNVVRTYGLHQPTGDADSPTLLLLEWVDGKTLDHWYAEQARPVKWDIIKPLCLDLLAGVAELHGNGIFHRDLKPENVMVRGDGGAVVMDIGLAELTGDNEHTLHTSVRDFVGSVRYASPQFIIGDEEFTAADDVYSLGATFFLLFTGKLIYGEIERKPVLPIVVVTQAPKVDSLQDTVPASMKVLLQGCLHRDRKRRPSLKEVEDAIQNPSSAQYITRELELQAAEIRSYAILDVFDDGGSFVADLAGDNPELDTLYRVVRHGKRLMVPSYSREITPEMWVAEAILKHVHANVGHFSVLTKRWQEGRSPMGSVSSLMGTAGQWIDQEKISPKVRKGDFVLKNPA